MQTISVFTISGECQNEHTERNATLNEEIAEPQQTTVLSTSENPAYGDIPNGSKDYYYVNEEMGGLAEVKMAHCQAYEPQPISNTLVSDSTTSDYYVNEGMDGVAVRAGGDTDQQTGAAANLREDDSHFQFS